MVLTGGDSIIGRPHTVVRDLQVTVDNRRVGPLLCGAGVELRPALAQVTRLRGKRLDPRLSTNVRWKWFSGRIDRHDGLHGRAHRGSAC